MVNWLRRLLGVHSPSLHGMTQAECAECGRLLQEGFEEGYSSVKEKCAAFQMDTRKAIEEVINSEK